MILKSLTIKRVETGKSAGKIEAELTTKYTVPIYGELKITLPDEVAIEIVRLAAPYISESLKDSMVSMASEAETILLGEVVEAETVE